MRYGSTRLHGGPPSRGSIAAKEEDVKRKAAVRGEWGISEPAPEVKGGSSKLGFLALGPYGPANNNHTYHQVWRPGSPKIIQISSSH